MKTVKRSLRYTVWVYFMLFISAILILLWLSFVVSLESNYQVMKTADITTVANYIINHSDDENFADDLDKMAFDNNMCISITDLRGVTLYAYDGLGGNCLIHDDHNANLFYYRNKVLESEDGFIYYQATNPKFKNKTLLFVMLLKKDGVPTGFVYLNTSLEPIESTAIIIKKQILQITIVLFVLGLIISFFLAKLIATPIIRITKSADKLAKGDFSEKFDGYGYDETEALAATLNYASNEISKVDSLRRDLIANISHDLRTPLTMIKAYAEMIRDLSGDNPVKREQHVGVIIEESDRLASLVNDILDLSKLENGSKPEKRRFDISEKLMDVMKRYDVLTEQKGYRFFLSIDASHTIDADVQRIEQVLYNLINNAVNYTGENKTVYITQLMRGNNVRIEITDTGDGIDEELLPLIFDRYYRAEKHKREVVGTGLGLSIVKQILVAHGFPYGVQSRKGVGSTFWFEAPVCDLEEESKEHTNSLSLGRRKNDNNTPKK